MISKISKKIKHLFKCKCKFKCILNSKQYKHSEKVSYIIGKINGYEDFGNYLLKNYKPTVDKEYWQNEKGDIFNSKELYFKYLNNIESEE